MKIENGVKSAGTAKATAKLPGAVEAPARQAEPVKATRVDISSLSARMQVMDTGMGDGVDASRVAEIKAAIASGRFTVNPERIADGLLANVREMLKRGG